MLSLPNSEINAVNVFFHFLERFSRVKIKFKPALMQVLQGFQPNLKLL